MKKLTIEEYKEKLEEAKQKAYGILADDSKEHTFYVLHERNDDGDLKDILFCTLDSEGEILDFRLYDKNLNLQRPLCKDVEKLFENGDVIEVTRAPLEGVYYGIYLYNKDDENPHSVLTHGCHGYSCFGIKNLDEISKVEKCPEDKINILSENIKKRKGDYIKVFKEERINVSYLPF